MLLILFITIYKEKPRKPDSVSCFFLWKLNRGINASGLCRNRLAYLSPELGVLIINFDGFFKLFARFLIILRRNRHKT